MHRISAFSGGCEVSHLAVVSLGRLGLGVTLLCTRGAWGKGEKLVVASAIRGLFFPHSFSFFSSHRNLLYSRSTYRPERG